MRNVSDYAAGFTKKTFNSRTGKFCSGGAARNLHTAEGGGLAERESKAAAAGFLEAFRVLQPVVENYSKQLEEYRSFLVQLKETTPETFDKF